MEDLIVFFRGYMSLSEWGYSIDKIINKLERHNPGFSKEGLKSNLIEKLNDNSFDWIKIALETKFVPTADDMPPREFKIDDLLIYSGLVGTISNREAKLAEEEREKLSDQLRNVDIHSFSNIHELMDSEQFSWLRFATKHDYKLAFGEIYYTKEDVVFHVKKAAWEYLFPDTLDQERMELISHECNKLLKGHAANDGWMDMDEMVEVVSQTYPEVDIYLLSKVNWDKKIQSLNHFRNPIALGFKRHRT